MFENLQVLLPVFFVWVWILYLHLSHIIVCYSFLSCLRPAVGWRGYEGRSGVYFHSVCEQAGNGAFALYYGGGLVTPGGKKKTHAADKFIPAVTE